MLRLYALPSLFLLALLLATSSLVSAQFDARTTPKCCLTCWRSVRSSASLMVGSFTNGHEMGGMPEWCDDQELVGKLTSCWEDTCVRLGLGSLSITRRHGQAIHASADVR